MAPPLRSTPSAPTRRVLGSDPRLAYHLFAPEARGGERPLVVSVHGASRNVDVHARLLSAYAEMYGAILLVPHFSAVTYADYHRLGRMGRGKRADLALHRLVAEVAGLTGARADRFHLFGFSAGAQFAHRYALAYPHRVAFAVLADAGRYTAPDPTRRFPRGIRSTRKLPGVRFDPDAFLRVPMKVLVGREVAATTLPRRSRPGADPARTRAERGHAWVAAMREACLERGLDPAVTCEELPDRIRSFRSSVLRGGLAERAFEAMLGAPLVERASVAPAADTIQQPA